MIRRPPRSTLFPTRRSSDLDGDLVFTGCLPAASFADELLSRWDLAQASGVSSMVRYRFVVDRESLDESVRALDRKSTRLNSSHANISYAVFCLKKKQTKLKA